MLEANISTQPNLVPWPFFSYGSGSLESPFASESPGLMSDEQVLEIPQKKGSLEVQSPDLM